MFDLYSNIIILIDLTYRSSIIVPIVEKELFRKKIILILNSLSLIVV